MTIREIAQQAIATGYLTIEAEQKIQTLASTGSKLEEINALMSLQLATLAGRVKQESRKLMGQQPGRLSLVEA